MAVRKNNPVELSEATPLDLETPGVTVTPAPSVDTTALEEKIEALEKKVQELEQYKEESEKAINLIADTGGEGDK